MFSVKRLKEIINMLPKEVNPRIGGSCALYFYGDVDTYRDVDIIDFKAFTFIHESKKIINTVNNNLKEGIHNSFEKEYLATIFSNCSWQSWLRIVKHSFFKDISYHISN